MKTKIGTSFGLALLLALGVLVAMLALGMFSASKAEAAMTQQTAAEQTTLPDTQIVMTAVDPGGGTSILNDQSTVVVTVTLTTFALGEEGFGTVPGHPLIKPIAASGSLPHGFDVDDRSAVSVGAVVSFTDTSLANTTTNSLATAAPINPY